MKTTSFIALLLCFTDALAEYKTRGYEGDTVIETVRSVRRKVRLLKATPAVAKATVPKAQTAVKKVVTGKKSAPGGGVVGGKKSGSSGKKRAPPVSKVTKHPKVTHPPIPQ